MEAGLDMRPVRWITLAWPGLTQLWFSGTAWGLSVACSFAWLFSFAVVSTFVWTELIGPWMKVGVWLLLLVVWVMSLGLSFRQLRQSDPVKERAAADVAFRKAQHEYLTGNWVGAEQQLTQLIETDPQDIDAQLLLATLLRRTGHLTEAASQLRRLEATDGAEKWRSEIDRERKLLDELFHPQTSTNEEQPTTEHQSTTDSRQADDSSAANRAA